MVEIRLAAWQPSILVVLPSVALDERRREDMGNPGQAGGGREGEGKRGRKREKQAYKIHYTQLSPCTCTVLLCDVVVATPDHTDSPQLRLP